MSSSSNTHKRWLASILWGFLGLAGFVAFVDTAWTVRADEEDPPPKAKESDDKKSESEKKKETKEEAKEESDAEEDEEDIEAALKRLQELAKQSLEKEKKEKEKKEKESAKSPASKPAPKQPAVKKGPKPAKVTPKRMPKIPTAGKSGKPGVKKSPSPKTPDVKKGKKSPKNRRTGKTSRPVGSNKTTPTRRMDRPGRATGSPAAAKPAAKKVGDNASKPVLKNVTTTTRPAPIFDMEPPDPEKRAYRFNYVDEPWDGVLKDFARMSGLFYLPKLPEGGISEKLSYLSPKEMSFGEALHTLNDLLFEQRAFNNLVIYRSESYLIVEPLPDLMSNVPLAKMFETFEEFEAAKLDPYDVCKTYIDLPDKWTPYKIIDEFRTMFSDNYGVDAVGDRIELTGLVKEHYEFKQVIKELAEGKEPPPEDPRPKVTFELKAQKVNDVSQILRGLYPVEGPAPTPRRGGRRKKVAPESIDPNAEKAKKLSIFPDLKNNLLYARGPQYLLDEVRETIKKLDIGGYAPPKMEVIRLKNATAAVLASLLKPILQQQQAELKKTTYWVNPALIDAVRCNIYPDASGNSVILYGGDEGIARTRTLVEQYDVPPDRVTEVIELTHADANNIIPSIVQNLPAPKSKGAPHMPQITALSSKKLLVACARQDYQKVLDLVEKLDVLDVEEPHEHMMELKCGEPSVISQIVQQIVSGVSSPAPRAAAVGKNAKRRSRARAKARAAAAAADGDGPKFFPNDEAGTILVFCADGDWERIEALIKGQDELACQVEPVFRSVVLEKANAVDVARTINNMFPPPAGAQQLVEADVYNRTINIFARPAFLDKALPLIEMLDVNAEAELTVIPLEHCKAQDIAPILSRSFGGGGRARTRSVPRKKGQKSAPPSVITGNTSVNIVAEPVTNVLLVTAPPKELEQIQELVAGMEVEAEKLKPVQIIVEAVNRPAEEIAAILNSVMVGGRAAPAKSKKRAPAQVGSGNPVAEPLKIVVASGERIILDGPQEEVAEAIQLIQNIDIGDQRLTRNIRVLDAEEDEKKLRRMLGMGGGPSRPTAPKKGAAARRVRAPAATSDGIQIYADIYNNSLLISAMPKDWIEIDKQLEIILGEVETPVALDDDDIGDDFFEIKLKHTTAWDMSFTLEDLINTDERSKVKFIEGPNEKTLIVQNCKPMQRDKVMRYIAIFDVSPYPEDDNIMILDPEGKMPPGRLAQMLMEQWQIREGDDIKLVGMDEADNLVEVIDIHADEEEENAKDAQPVSPVSPCVLPASMLHSLQALSVGQSVGADQSGPVAEEVNCPVCHQSPCVLPAKLMSSLDAIVKTSVDGEEVPEATPEHVHNHVVTAEVSASDEESDSMTDEDDEPSPPRSNVASKPREKVFPEVMPGITLRPDPETGNIIVIGKPEKLEKLREMMEATLATKAPTVIKIFPLKYADVTQAAQLLNNIFNQPKARAVPQQRGRQQGGAKGKQQQPQGGKGQAAANALPQPGRQPGRTTSSGKARIKVVPDPRTRSLYVVAPAPDIPLIVNVLKNIDTRIMVEGEFRIFKLKNLEAEQVVQSLREILGLNKTTAPTGRRGQQRGAKNQPQPNQQVVQLQGQQGTVVSADKVKLTAETQTNTVMAQAPPDTLDLIGTIIDQLEEETNFGEYITRRVPLVHARATDIASAVQDLVQAMTKNTAKGGAKGRSSGVSVSADSRTNSVILVGTLKELEKAEGLIREMDGEGPANTIQQFKVKGEAKAIAETLKKLYDSGPKSDIVITWNEPTNTLIVKAPPPQMVEIKQQIEDMDQEIETITELRTIKLAIADAGSMAEKLTNIFGGARGGRKNQQDITIAGYDDTLFVRCSDEDFPRIEKIARDMDKVDESIQVHRFALDHKPAEEVHQALQTMIAEAMTRGGGDLNLDYVSLVPDPRTNSLVLVGGPKSALLLTQLLKEVDVMPDGDAKDRKLIRLRHAKADEIAPSVIEALKSKVLPIGPNEFPFSIVPDVSSKTLIVTARRSLMPEIESMIEGLDVSGEGDRREHVIEVANTNPEDVANSLQRIFNESIKGRRDTTAPTIQAVRGSSKIVALATEEEFTQIKGLVEQVDIGGGRVVHTVTMTEDVPAQTVADNINKIYGERGQDGIKAEHHEPTNTLLVSATPTEFEKIFEQVIQPISDRPAVAKLNFYKIPLKYAVADEVAQTLQDFFDKKAGNNRRGTRLPPWMGGGTTASEIRENQVTITAEPTSNTLLVFATASTKELIDELITDIDADLRGDRVFEMVELAYMDASEMLEIMTEILKVSKRSEPEEDRRFVPWWADRQEEDDDKTVLAGDMRLKAIESTNSIIVAGRPEGVADAVTKIKELDVPTSGTEPQMFTFAHARAADVADVLKQVFAEGQRTGSSGRGGRGRFGRGGGRATSSQPLAIVPVDASNSILVSGKKSKVNEVIAMAKTLDSQMQDEPAGVRIVAIPTGHNVEELAELVETQINQAENSIKDRRSDYRPDRVTIGADRRANALLVSASKSQFEKVKKVVDDLVAMGPAGRDRIMIKLDKMSPEEAMELIEKLRRGGDSGSNRGNTRGRSSGRRTSGRRGRRGDANWTQDRRYEGMQERGMKGNTFQRTTVAASMPVLMMHLALGTAIAQTKTDEPKKRPVVTTIRPRTTTTQPAERTPSRSTSRPARNMTPDELIRAANQLRANDRRAARSPEDRARAAAGKDRSPFSKEAEEIMRRQLSGGDVDVAIVGDGRLILEGAPEDLRILGAMIESLDSEIPDKIIEYILLKNAQAETLASKLQEVFQKKIEGDREILPREKIDLIADPRNNGLYVVATEDKMLDALDLIQRSDIDEAVDKKVKAFQFENRRVSEAGEVLKKIAATYLKQRKLPATMISIELDPFSNKVFVTAGESDLNFIEQTVKTLDAELPEEVQEKAKGRIGEADIMVVPLRIAAADTLAQILNTLLERAAKGDTPMQDFIRRFRLLDENGNPLASVNLNRPVFVFGEPDSNSIIIASSLENCLIMKQVALAFDKEPAKMPVESKVFTLNYADATNVAEKLDTMLAASEDLTARPGKGDKGGVPEGDAGSLVYKAVVTADARTNQVIVVGRPEAVQTMTGLIESLDVRGIEVMPFDIIKLEYASATGLATALNEMMEKRKGALPETGGNSDKAETVIITPDSRSQSLIIAARRERMEELRDLIKKLDIKATALIDNIRTITLRNGNATELAEKLKDLWQQTKDQRGGESGGFELETPAIVADERSNSLIVAASPSDFDAIKETVEKIEDLPLNPMSDIYIVRLQHNSAQQLQSAMQSLFDRRAEMRAPSGDARPEDKVTIEVDEVTNSLLVAASRENYDVLMQKVQALDVEIGVMGQIEFFACDNVNATRIKTTVDELFQEGPFKPGTTGDSPVAQEREKVTAVVDARSNVLIVSASPENMELVRQVHRRMNSVTTPWDAAIVKLVDLKHAECIEVASKVNTYFEELDQKIREGDESDRAALFAVEVITDDRSNRLIVGGTKDGIDRAMALIEQLDVPPGRRFEEVRVYSLNEANAQQVGEIITNIFQERNQARGGNEGGAAQPIPVTVETDASGNALVINASRYDHVIVTELITMLDRPTAMLNMVRVLHLKKARAEKIKEIMDQAYQAGDSQNQTISFVADERTNSIVAAAPPGELDNIAKIITRLDSTESVEAFEVGIFQCSNEDASKMAELLNEILSAEPAEGGSSSDDEMFRAPKTYMIDYVDEDEYGRKELVRAIRENVQITFNERTNTVIVAASPSTLRLVEKLVKKLDGIEKQEVVVRVFGLTHADATRMVEVLEEMFAQDEGSQQQEEFQQDREIVVEGGMSGGGVGPASEQSGTFGRPRTTFVADERTNSVIAAGWFKDIDVVSDIIAQLDSRDTQDRVSFIYPAVNMTAEEMQGALDEYFQAENAVFEQLEDVSPQQRMAREVSIVAHTESNQLIVSASPRRQSEVLRLIEDLDTPPPQVMIQVMIAEVTLDDNFEMGLEFALQQLRFSETAVAGPNGVLQSSSFDVVGGTDLGAAGSGLGGFSFTITGEDFNFLVRALQSDSRLEVIQRPMIMCQDNQEANITIGQEVPTITGSQQTDSGQVNSQVQYRDVGIILNVTPNINPDGWVYLQVAPEVSAIADSTVQISPGVFAPIFTERSADTFVAVKDGETVVIGGLITTTESEAESKVPVLGDVPGVGNLFRTTTRSKNKTELIFALTPRIVRTVEDGRRLSIEERDKSGIITDQMKQSPLFERLRIAPETNDEIETIEDFPDEYAPGRMKEVEPVKTRPKKKYGPKAPRYGPMVPSDDVVARRTSRLNTR
ncbi:MAG: hypothetical protein MI923_26460 [Phycisphaerales bacterium]|nr:hypothetical protein [Phycisphaerales bacterium]